MSVSCKQGTIVQEIDHLMFNRTAKSKSHIDQNENTVEGYLSSRSGEIPVP